MHSKVYKKTVLVLTVLAITVTGVYTATLDRASDTKENTNLVGTDNNVVDKQLDVDKRGFTEDSDVDKRDLEAGESKVKRSWDHDSSGYGDDHDAGYGSSGYGNKKETIKVPASYKKSGKKTLLKTYTSKVVPFVKSGVTYVPRRYHVYGQRHITVPHYRRVTTTVKDLGPGPAKVRKVLTGIRHESTPGSQRSINKHIGSYTAPTVGVAKYGAPTKGYVAVSTQKTGGGYGNDHASSGYGKSYGSSSGYGKSYGSSSGYGKSYGSSGYGKSYGSSGYGNDHASSGYGNDHASSGYGNDHASGYGNDHASGYGNEYVSSGYGNDHGSSGYGSGNSYGSH